jgi:SAM-dependent methyltransferase
MLFVFTAATFLGAGLVFLIQPMVAKMLLPLLGGTPAVWITAMLFFQAALLAGYGYAHVSTARLGLRRQPLVHILLLLLPLPFLPVALPERWVPPVEGSPVGWLLLALVLVVGLPYLAVTTASPLLQRWFSGTDHREASDPYFLYAAGNAGSLLALLAYPFILEPRLTLRAQALVWTGGYVLFVVLSVACILFLRRRPARAAPPDRAGSKRRGKERGKSSAAGTAIDTWTRLRWMLYAFVPSSLMLGVTQHLTTDLAAAPLLWVLPLTLYLLTFVIAFARLADPVVRLASGLLPFAAVALGLELLDVLEPALWIRIALHLATLTLVGLVAHGRLAAERPAPERLTGFFLLISVGGVLGGVLNALLAPLVFPILLEYPLVLAVAVFLRPPRAALDPVPGYVTATGLALAALVSVLVIFLIPAAESQPVIFWVLLAVTVGAVYLLVVHPRPVAAGLAAAAVLAAATVPTEVAFYRSRTFFGVQEVRRYGNPESGYHLLYHGTTIHGGQLVQDGELRPTPITYYAPSGPIGSFVNLRQQGDPEALDRVAVVGLGAGTMATFGRPGDTYVFYEIDPEMRAIAQDPDLFTFLPDSAAETTVVLGDGRLRIAEAPRAEFDMILLDAFTSDAVPIHLLTREAVATYLDKLAPGGVLAFNVSNKYVDLQPPLAAIAGDLGLSGVVAEDSVEDRDRVKYASRWVLLAPDAPSLPAPDGLPWRVLDPPEVGPPWTDEFSDIASVVSWG